MKKRYLILFFLMNLIFVNNVMSRDEQAQQNVTIDKPIDSKPEVVNEDLKQWSHTIKSGNNTNSNFNNNVPVYDPNSYFELSRQETDLRVKDMQALSNFIEKYIEERQVETINSRLYNTGAKGEPAPAAPDVELYDTHSKLFCSPYSGYEQELFKDCNKDNPLILQHADLKPIVLSNNKFGKEMIPIVRNWIDNFLVSFINSDVPKYIRDKNPEEMSKKDNMENYIHRLRNQIASSVAANSLNMMLARRIPLNESKDSESLESSLAEEVNKRYLNTDWQIEISKIDNTLELMKEQTRILSLLSYQMKGMDERLERIELLNAALVNQGVNQTTMAYDMLKDDRKGKK